MIKRGGRILLFVVVVLRAAVRLRDTRTLPSSPIPKTTFFFTVRVQSKQVALLLLHPKESPPALSSPPYIDQPRGPKSFSCREIICTPPDNHAVTNDSPFIDPSPAPYVSRCILPPENLYAGINNSSCSGGRRLSTASTAVGNGNGDGSGKDGCVVVVTSGKGGVGKTTTAASISYGLAQVRAGVGVP